MGSEQIDTGTDEVEAHLEENGVAVVRLNRPDRLNALTVGLMNGLERALGLLEDREDARCILLTGAGRAFCAGGDISEVDKGGHSSGASGPAGEMAYQRKMQRGIVNRIWKMAKPVIASLPGPTVGAGLSLAVSCDFRIASDEAVISTGFGNMALPGDLNINFFLTHLVGAAKAREVLYLPQKFTAKEALDLGLVSRVVPHEDLEAEAMDWASRYAAGPTVAIGMMKQSINRAISVDIDECLDWELVNTGACFKTADTKEAVRAFMEKRRPEFKGR